jgi:hypothetical protein
MSNVDGETNMKTDCEYDNSSASERVNSFDNAVWGD